MRAPQRLTNRGSVRSLSPGPGARRPAVTPGSTRPPVTGTPRAPVRPGRPGISAVTPLSVVSLDPRAAYFNFINKYNQTLSNDPLLQDLRQRQINNNIALQQKQRQYLNSLGLTQEQLRNPQIMQRIAPNINNFMRRQREYQILMNLNNSQRQYINRTYPDLMRQMQQYQQQMENLPPPGFSPSVTQPTPGVATISPPGVSTISTPGVAPISPPGVAPISPPGVAPIPPEQYTQPPRTTGTLGSPTGLGGLFGGNASPASTMFDPQSLYEIKGNNLYKDGKFMGQLGGGMLGGGTAGQNQIVMGNDAVVTVPDSILTGATRTEIDPSVDTTPPKPSPYDNPNNIFNIFNKTQQKAYDQFNQQTGQTTTPSTTPTRPGPNVDPRVTPKFKEPKRFVDPIRTPIVNRPNRPPSADPIRRPPPLPRVMPQGLGSPSIIR